MSNYEWEKQYAKQRINARMRESELHRQAAAGQPVPDAHPRPPRRNLFIAALRAFSRLFPARRPTN